MIEFREWVDKKIQGSEPSDRVQRLREWKTAYDQLVNEMMAWLIDEGDGRVWFDKIPIERNERGLGSYHIEKLQISVGDETVEVIPMGRNVLGSFGPSAGPEYRGAGRVDVTDGFRKYRLYRTIQDGMDVWYVIDEQDRVSSFDKGKFLEIVMDLMS